MMPNVTLKFGIAVCVATVSVIIDAKDANAEDCVESTIISPQPFMGNNGEIFKLVDGSVWEVKYEYEYLYEYYPTVFICPSNGKLIVGEKSLNVQAVVSNAIAPNTSKKSISQSGKWVVFEETKLQGAISGTVKLGSVFKTISGNIYEVTGLTLQLVLELQPDVMVLSDGNNYKLIVEGFDEPLICKKLN